MARWLPLLAGALALASCGRVWKEYEFVEEYPERMCDRATACGWVADYDACVDERREAIEQDQLLCDDYDSSSVGDCFQEIRALGCDALEYEDPYVHPFSCRLVFDCSVYATF